jgi:VWFA-related protein
MKNRILGVWALAAGAAATVITLGGQASQENRLQQRPLRHDAAAVVKLVPVRVLDKDGKPVARLRKEDFVLYEDGQRKSITEFEEHAVTEAGMTVAPVLAGGTEALSSRTGAMNRKIFIFLDQQASDRAGKDKAKAVALRFLETQVRPGDEVAVIGFYAMSGFYIREYLTTDMKKIRKAIDGLTEAPPKPGEPVGGSDDSVDTGRDTNIPQNLVRHLAAKEVSVTEVSSGGSGGGILMAPGTAAFQHTDFVPRLAEVAEVFKTIPGNKSLVIFTARDMGSEAGPIGRLFATAGTSVYPVNTQDWDTGPFGTKFKKIWWDHSLKELAAASGGRYFADINAAAEIARDIQDLTGNYYVLGYYVRESWEGRYHKIRVEIPARPDVQILVQDGYADAKPFAKMSGFEKDIHLLDLTWSDQPAGSPNILPVDALVVHGNGSSQACLLSRWEIGGQTGVPASPVEVYALLRDEAGIPIVSRKWNVDLTSYEGRVLFSYLSSPVPSGTCELRLVVRDRRTGDAGVGRTSFEVAAPPEEGITMSSPLLFIPGNEATFMRLPTQQGATLNEKRPSAKGSLVSLYRLIPKEGQPVVGEIPFGTKKLVLVLPFELGPEHSEGEPILGVKARLLSREADRERSPAPAPETLLELNVREHRAFDGMPDILVAEIAVPPVSPGEYDLVISIDDVGTDRHADVAKRLVIR